MAFEKNFFFPSDFGFMRDFVFLFLVCRGLRLFLGCVWWWVGVSHLGFSLLLADGVPAPSPQEKEQSVGSGNQGDSAPMGAGDLARNAPWDGVGSGFQACIGDQAGSDFVERAGPDSPSLGRCFGKHGEQSTVCVVAGRGACMSVWFVCPRVTGREGEGDISYSVFPSNPDGTWSLPGLTQGG